MPEYLAPGVYVEEISTGPKPIEGVSTSVAGFVGPTERGTEDVTYITSWIAFQRWFGNHLGENFSYLSYAVQGFFDNGGQRCFVGRIVPRSAATDNLPASKLVDGLQIWAIGRGDWGNRLYYRVTPATKAKQNIQNAANWVRFQVAYFSKLPTTDPIVDFTKPENLKVAGLVFPDVFEDYDNVSLDPQAANNLKIAINLGSRLIRVDFPGAIPTTLTVSDTFTKLDGGDVAGINPIVDDYTGSVLPLSMDSKALLGQTRGLAGMDTVQEVSLLLAPDHVRFGGVDPQSDDLADKVITQCQLRKDRFAVLSTKLSFGVQNRPFQDTTYGAQYYPWIRIYDPYSRDDILVPPAGHVAGIMARTDIEQGVHKAPANAIVIGAKGLQKPVPKGDQDVLNPVGINCIRDFRSDGRGIRLWGARTMTSDPEWKYVNVRRLFIFLEQSIDEGTQWVVFEPNAPSTWARVQQTVANFLTTVWRNGALLGATRDEAFFVKCDRTTMTQDDIDNGRLICYIGVAPVKPAEFVIFRIGQKTADAPA